MSTYADPRLESLAPIFDELDDDIGVWLEAGYSYKLLAEVAGVSTSTLRRIRRRQDVRWSSMQRLCAVFGKELAIIPNEELEHEDQD